VIVVKPITTMVTNVEDIIKDCVELVHNTYSLSTLLFALDTNQESLASEHTVLDAWGYFSRRRQ